MFNVRINWTKKRLNYLKVSIINKLNKNEIGRK